ncbi:MAG: metallophosphoesterase [Burkholderiaceae bacterium]|jgi:hypothetical protein|nr:metallophosphoesterase [Burkholderiaceae bacterium]
MSYDIVGDVHGHADKLEQLLARMGYRKIAGTWRHPERQAIFVGDFIDRGPQQVETVDLVRRMVDDGQALAVMGNHEFNAIAWHLPDPIKPGDTLRTRAGALGEKNRQQHKKFLDAVVDRSKLHGEYVDWFLGLPLWLDLPGLRVVHACWHPGYMAELAPRLKQGRFLNAPLMEAASREGWMEFRTVEGLTKGLEVDLPEGHSFSDKDGHRRTRVRLRWWDRAARTYRQAAMMDNEELTRLPDVEVPETVRVEDDDPRPTFFGHYWLNGSPRLQSPTVACVDYSAGKGGALVAYRWDGEPMLDAARFVTSH